MNLALHNRDSTCVRVQTSLLPSHFTFSPMVLSVTPLTTRLESIAQPHARLRWAPRPDGYADIMPVREIDTDEDERVSVGDVRPSVIPCPLIC